MSLCVSCGGPMAPCERAAYFDRCEDCWVEACGKHIGSPRLLMEHFLGNLFDETQTGTAPARAEKTRRRKYRLKRLRSAERPPDSGEQPARGVEGRPPAAEFVPEGTSGEPDHPIQIGGESDGAHGGAPVSP